MHFRGHDPDLVKINRVFPGTRSRFGKDKAGHVPEIKRVMSPKKRQAGSSRQEPVGDPGCCYPFGHGEVLVYLS